ncbi:MAG: U32 family peptidase [Gammaproteobacteria bacterium]|nr:MAG: U32 family peptidase [Gammaproteobacteria bacterium]
MAVKNNIRISLGPITYYWSEQQISDFYHDIAKTNVDIVYLGEVICAKRRTQDYNGWLEIGRFLQKQGKQVILSTLTLIEAQSDIKTIKKICRNDEFLVEANDIATVQILSDLNLPFVTGPSVNIYNSQTLKILQKKGLKRWVMPVELSRQTLLDFQQKIDFDIETEIFTFGKMPLAYSARCYTARAYNLSKDDCQYKCIDDSDGKLLKTKEQQKFLNINGIQMQSAATSNLLNEIKNEKDANIDVVRINPQSKFTPDIIEVFNQTLKENNPINKDKLKKYILGESCNGYWFNSPGMNLL